MDYFTGKDLISATKLLGRKHGSNFELKSTVLRLACMETTALLLNGISTQRILEKVV